MKKHSIYNGFTLLEVICSLSIILLLLLSLLNISTYTFHKAHTYTQEITNHQVLDNLKDFILHEFKQNNVAVLDVNKDHCLIRYQVFKQDSALPGRYILSNKALIHRQEANMLVMTTKNTHYKKDGAGFTKLFNNKETTNILAEDITSITISQKEDTLYFSILTSKAEDGIEFHLSNRTDKFL